MKKQFLGKITMVEPNHYLKGAYHYEEKMVTTVYEHMDGCDVCNRM